MKGMEETGYAAGLQGMEEGLPESQGAYLSIFENIPVGLIIVDGDGWIQRVNLQFLRLAGFQTREEIEMKYRWIEFLLPEEVEWFHQLVLGDHSARRDPVEFRFVDRVGGQIHSLVAASAIDSAERQVISVFDISDQKHAQQIYKHLAEKMAVLHAISTAGSEVNSVDELIDRATEALEGLFHPGHCSVLLVNPEKQTIQLHPSYRGAIPNKSEIPIDQGITGWVIATGRTRRVDDTMLSSEYISPGEATMRSEICAPLRLGATVIGVVDVEAIPANAFTADDEDLITTFAVQLATAIDRLRSRKAEHHLAEQLAAIDEVSREIASASHDLEKVYVTIHHAVAKLMPSESFTLTLYDAVHEEIIGVYLYDRNGRYPAMRIPAGQGMTGLVIRSGQPLYIEEMDDVDGTIPILRFGSPERIHSALTVPLKLGKTTIGAMSTQSYRPRAFSRDDLHMLTLLSSHIAIALQNARLFAESNRQLMMFENMFDAIIVTDLQTQKILYWNQAACSMYGYTREEAIGQSINILHNPEDIPSFEENLTEEIQKNGRWAGEKVFVRKDGSQGLSEIIALPIYDDQGRMVFTIGVNRDITQRKQTEQALQKNEALLRLMLDSLPVGVWIADKRGQVFQANPAASQIWGSDSATQSHQIQEFKGWWPKTGEQISKEDWASSRAIQKGETSLNEEIDILAFDGTRKTILNSAIPILDEQKNIQGAIIVNQDMTGEKRREREREAILTVSAALRSASTRDEMVTIVCQQLDDLLAVDGIAILVQRVEPAQPGSLEVGAASGCWSSQVGKTIEQDQSSYQALDPAHLKLVNFQFENSLPNPGLPTAENDVLVEVPLETRDGVLGAVWMVKKAEFSSLEVSVTTAVADITANALHRLALFERTSRYAEQMRVVSEIGHTLAERMDLPGIYSKLAEGVLKLYADSAAVIIALYNAETETIHCTYGLVDGKVINPLELPPIPLVSSRQGQQSEVVRRRAPVIATDLKKTANTKGNNSDHKSEITQSALFVPMLSRGKVLGVLQIQSHIPNRFTQEDANLLGLVANTAAVAIENARLFSELQHSHSELSLAYDSTLEGWAHALELRDQETKDHSQRVVDYTLRLGQRLGIPETDLIHVRRGALLHDIGKMGISDQILNKPGSLSEEEWARMRQHPVFAYEMLKSIGYLRPALDIPYCHHEKWDGSGYPRNLAGEQIPLAARIFAVVDVWDALISDRPYRPAWTPEQALAYIAVQAGKHFDPQVVAAFLDMIHKGDFANDRFPI
ncbi:MAG TPA: GAF domain-containing protein [Anaerolineaceae bacterium]|nr:GAF domain-containing protein [Anaerolineaceae bacterium]